MVDGKKWRYAMILAASCVYLMLWPRVVVVVGDCVRWSYWNMQSLAWFLLCSRVGQFSWFNMAVMLAVLLKLLWTNLAARRWTISILLISLTWWGDQTVEAYSSIGWTYRLEALIKISLQESSCGICLFGYIIDVFGPWEVACDSYTKVVSRGQTLFSAEALIDLKL